jgi:isopentenyl-diphosphate delta-isomerase
MTDDSVDITGQEPRVVCVDPYGVEFIERDGAPRTMTKSLSHREGVLHLAISVFIFDSQGRFLLQQRQQDKYHSAGLWSNTCCSHPEPGEGPLAAASRRLEEEMGMSCDLVEVFTHLYRADFTPELKEHEFDRVFFGVSDERPIINTAEAQDFRYMSLAELDEDIRLHPERYTYWLRDILPKVRGVLGFVKMLGGRWG